jgi:deoxycytidylate deaminase
MRLLSAARAGTRTDCSALFTTHKPCFGCLKEAIQAGVQRVVYLNDYIASDHRSYVAQYELLAEHLRNNDARNFEQLCRQRDALKGTKVPARPPDLDREIQITAGTFAGGPS